MLSSMHQITDGQAESIARVYPSFKSLLNAFEAEPSQKGKERLLVGLPVRTAACSFFVAAEH